MLSVALLACHSAPVSQEPGSEAEAPLGTGLAPTALRRLTPSGYQNTVRDLFPRAVVPEVTLVADPLVFGFDGNGESQVPSALLIQQLADGAAAVAEAAAASESTLGCPVDGGPDPSGCGESFLRALGPRVFRRPLTADEQGEIDGLFAEVLAEDGFEVAVRVSLELWLQSPEFLYFPEFGVDGAATGVVPLGDYELASRLSYFLWNTVPDDALFAAAARGELTTDAGLSAQAERMLADPRSADGIDNFARFWLELDHVDAITLDPATYPTFDEPLRHDIEAEAAAFARGAIERGTLADLLTDPSAELTPAMAELYGAPSAGFTALPAGERAGILTRAAFLSTRAHAVHPSPVKRGVFVLDRLLCAPAAPPPPGVSTQVPESDGGPPTTNRDRYDVHSDRPECAGCHSSIDGIGFGFEHYDSLGQWRDTDGGLPVDATGVFLTGDLDGLTFDGAVEASGLLAGSRTVSDCVAERWLRYALGRSLERGDEATVAALEDAFVAAGGTFSDLRLAIVHSDAFRSRVAR